MKKLFLLVTATMLSISTYAQYTYDITIKKEPDYTQYGVGYTPTTSPNTKSSVPDLYEINRQNREMMQSIENKWAAEERAIQEANKIVSQEVQLFQGIKLGTNQSTLIRANVITRKNGRIDITCMGIKNGQNWRPCSKPIMSLQNMYNNAKSESEKSMILDLMDLGNFLLDTGNEMYVIK